MNYIIQTDRSFDEQVLIREYQSVYQMVKADQINIRKPGNITDKEGISYGSGSLVKDKKAFDNDRSWDSYIQSLNIPYTIEVLKQLEQYAGYVYNAKIGRARYMSLPPKTCLSYHIDYDNIIRLHIPLITNDHCFFVNNDTVGRMNVLGTLYEFNSKVRHTAVNASREHRVHIVANCYL